MYPVLHVIQRSFKVKTLYAGSGSRAWPKIYFRFDKSVFMNRVLRSSFQATGNSRLEPQITDV